MDSDPTLVEIIVDDLPVPVDEAAYLEDPDRVRAEVRAARLAAAGDLSHLHADFPDYDTLDAIAAHQAGL